MSRFALEWAKYQQPEGVEAKAVLLVVGDHAEGPNSTCTLNEEKLSWFTGIDRAGLPDVIKRLESGGYVKTVIEPRAMGSSVPEGVRNYQARTWGNVINIHLCIPQDWRGPARAPRPSGRTIGETDRPTAVYRLYDAKGVLCYVGIAVDPEYRFVQHELKQPWWYQIATREITWYLDRFSAAAEEYRAINQDSPLHNVQHAEGVPRKVVPQAKRYAKETMRSLMHRRASERFRADLWAGVFDIGPIPASSRLSGRYGYSLSIIEQARSDLVRSGEITYIKEQGIYVRDWSEW